MKEELQSILWHDMANLVSALQLLTEMMESASEEERKEICRKAKTIAMAMAKLVHYQGRVKELYSRSSCLCDLLPPSTTRIVSSESAQYVVVPDIFGVVFNDLSENSSRHGHATVCSVDACIRELSSKIMALEYPRPTSD